MAPRHLLHASIRILLTAILVASAGVASAQTTPKPVWQPPEPSAKERDWIRLTSGEWLMGDLKGLQDKDLDFDSEELDDLDLDWDDVAELRSARILTYRFEDLGTFTGTATMREGVVAIKVGNQVQEFPRDKLLMILEGGQKEWDFWSAKASFGLVARSGNTDQADVNTLINIRRQSPKLRLNLNYTGNFGEVSGTENINNHNLMLTFDALITAGFFVPPAAFNFFADRFQTIESRYTLMAGVGYSFFRGGKLDWSVGLGGGYLVTNYVSVQPGEDIQEKSGAVIPNTDLEWDITPDIEFTFNYNSQIGISSASNTFHHAFGMISVDVWGDLLDLDWSVTWDHVSDPREDAGGNVPKKNDYRTSIGIGVDI